MNTLLERAERIHKQQSKDRNKLYALHAPEVECIGKGKARKPYEFGVKASITVTHKQGLIVGAKTFPGNPYDGQAVEPVIGHLKSDDRMDRCWLQGKLGDALHAVLYAAGYNLRWLVASNGSPGTEGGFFAPFIDSVGQSYKERAYNC